MSVTPNFFFLGVAGEKKKEKEESEREKKTAVLRERERERSLFSISLVRPNQFQCIIRSKERSGGRFASRWGPLRAR